jgi:DNA-3-methyladenine glycosylase
MNHPDLIRFCDRPAVQVAPDLLGAALLVGGVGGIIVEAEAYEPDDPASHSFGGPTARNAAMFGPPAHAYVYRSYGIHWCFNIVCRGASAVLVRALEPKWGIERMVERRGTSEISALAAGPGRLTQALAIDKSHDARPLGAGGIELRPTVIRPVIVCGVRIGITKAADRPWRYGIAGSPFVSRRF